MNTEQQQLDDMHARVRRVFPMDLLNSMAPQQRTLTNNAINRVLNKDGPEALTVDRLEGIKELVTQHLWSDAHTAAFQSLPPSEQQPKQKDLQNLSEDTALGAIKEMPRSRLAKIQSCMKGFDCLSPDWNLFTATVNESVIDQVLNGIEGWTELVRTFPVVIGVRTGNRLFLLFRSPEEEASATESTALAMVAAYQADELFLCFVTDALKDQKVCLITRSRNTDGTGLFFDLTKSQDRWEIGDCIGKIEPNILSDFTGAIAFKKFNIEAERARSSEAKQSLINWKSQYDWRF